MVLLNMMKRAVGGNPYLIEKKETYSCRLIEWMLWGFVRNFRTCIGRVMAYNCRIR